MIFIGKVSTDKTQLNALKTEIVFVLIDSRLIMNQFMRVMKPQD